jgi:FkbM family methyltransferase
VYEWEGYKGDMMDIKRLKTFMDQIKNPYLFVLQLAVYKLIANVLGLNHAMFQWMFPITIKNGGYKSRYVFQITKQLNLEEKTFFNIFKDPKYKVMVDVGSAIGSISDYFLRQNPQRRVYCFEPQNEFVSKSIEVLSDFMWVTIYNVALGESERIAKFYTRYKNDQKGSLVLKHKYIQNVVVKTLDSYSLPKIDLIKYDVEGAELQVIKGSLETINRWKPDILFENNDPDDTIVNEISKLLVGYKIRCIGVTAGQNKGSSYNNYIAEHK